MADGIKQSDRARMVGVLYLTVVYSESSFETRSINLRNLIMELRTLIKLSDKPEDEKGKDLKTISICNQLWRNLVFDKIDKDQITATADSHDILDEVSELVGKYGRIDFSDYAKVVVPRSTPSNEAT